MSDRRAVIDAESGKPIDRYAAEGAEKTIAGWAYPAIVPSKIRRILAHKLVEINRIAYANQREIEGIFIEHYTTTEIAKLPKDMRRDIQKLIEAKAIVEVLQKKLVEDYKFADAWLNAKQTTVRIYRGDETIKAEQDAKKARTFKAKADHDSAIEDFKVLLGDVVAEELAKVRKKVNPDLIARLDAIGPERQLLPENPVHPKTEMQNLVDEVLRDPLDILDKVRNAHMRIFGPVPVTEEVIDLDAKTVEREQRDTERRERKMARLAKTPKRKGPRS